MIICDICKTSVKKINELRDDYKSDNVIEVCDTCINEINSVFDKVIVAQRIQRRGFILSLIDKMIAKNTPAFPTEVDPDFV